MKPKPYIIRGKRSILDHTIVKVSYGNKYVIAKCKNQEGYLRTMQNDLNAFIRGGKNSETGTFFYLYNYVKAHPGETFVVESLLITDNGYELLKKEQEELDSGRNKRNFMNNQVNAHIPEYDPATASYGWISVNSVLNFQKWLKTRKKQRRKSIA
jgi:hypothetical protein